MTDQISKTLRRIPKWEWVVLLLMIAIALASRFYLATHWNIKPIAALLLFGGFYFRHGLTICLAILAIWAILFWSDLHFGLYQWQLMTANYAAFGLAALIGLAVGKILGRDLKGWRWLPVFGGASIVMSTLFFLLSNGAVWAFATYYPRDWGGMIECYVAGIPFYLRTLVGDLIFTGTAVGSYVIVRQLSLKTHSVLENEHAC
jgi:hypothetical protein